jgi:signal transduction histidine kinase
MLQRERRATTSYATAHQLLTELRDVSRELQTGLDEVSLSQQVLAALDESRPFDRGAVYTRDLSGIISPLAYRGADRLNWNPASQMSFWDDAFRTSSPLQRDEAITADSAGFSAYFPMRLGERTIGLVAVERESAPWSARNLDAAQEVVDDAALRIETGQLFSEVRSIATVEERRRLAREIHDGIAQEIASLGYVVDDLSARSDDDGVSQDLLSLRGELSRIVSELRLSIFDLRSDVQPSAGLGAALSNYVRSMSTGTGITMHLVLDESSLRLPIEIETEVLRIAQEAITNARKHARARNLWVTCRVDPPRAFLRIADDGQGLGSPRGDSFGMEIMHERASRIGAELLIRQRVGGGTVVEVSLGEPVT